MFTGLFHRYEIDINRNLCFINVNIYMFINKEDYRMKIKTSDSKVFMTISAFGDDTESLMQFLSNQDNNGNTPLHRAANNGHTAIVNKILSAFGDDTERLMQFLSFKNNYGETPLHLAASEGHTTIVEELLSAFEGDTANLLKLLSIKDCLKCTPLHTAAINGHTEIVKMIINKLSPAEALQLLYETNYKGRNVYADSVIMRTPLNSINMKKLLNSIGANKTSNYLYVDDQTDIANSNETFAAATHIVIKTDELKSSIPEKYHSKVINLTTKDIIEEAIKKAIEKATKDHPISKELLENTPCSADIISIITPYAITTIEILSLRESLRRVPYYGGGEKYQELLGFAARLLVKNPLLNFEAIKFTGNYDDDMVLLSFVEQMLTNNYQLKINNNGQEQGFNLRARFEKYHNALNISKESVDTILKTVILERGCFYHTRFSFEQFKLPLIKVAETQVPAIPAGELANNNAKNTGYAKSLNTFLENLSDFFEYTLI